jgi:hypothetical protein
MKIGCALGCAFFLLWSVALTESASAQLKSSCDDAEKLLKSLNKVIAFGPVLGCKAKTQTDAQWDAGWACAELFGNHSPYAIPGTWPILNWIDTPLGPYFLPQTWLGYCVGAEPPPGTVKDQAKADALKKQLQDALETFGKK